MAFSEFLLQFEVRIFSVGMSFQVLKKFMFVGSEGFFEIFIDDEYQVVIFLDIKKEIVSITMVIVQQFLELNGEDELVFTLVEELIISGVLDSGRFISIISFNSDCFVQVLVLGFRFVSIIGSVSEDLECYFSVVFVFEVSIIQFLFFSKLSLDEKGREVGSRRFFISFWLSEMSTGSDGEQSCYSFIAQTCFGYGEVMVDFLVSEFVSSIQNIVVVCREKFKVSFDNLFILFEMGEDTFNKVIFIKGCKIFILGKVMVIIFNTVNLSSCEGYIFMKINIIVYFCIVMSFRNV